MKHRCIQAPLLQRIHLMAILSVLLLGANPAGSRRAPQAVADAYTVARGAFLSIPAPGVLSNDSGAIVATLVSGPSYGALDFRADGSFTYNHDGSGVASDAFTYKASDGLTTSSTVTVTITVSDVSFVRGTLSGHSMIQPTSIQFGPDGKLYGLRKLGHIHAMDVVRDGPGTYHVSNEEVIALVRNIKNHDDDGYPNNDKNRQSTGLLVAGTASNPVIYVTSSDNRVGGGTNGTDTWLDTNSGVVSRVSWIGTSRNDPSGHWEKIDLVRGLPRSEENHAPNGLQLSVTGDTLFVTSGGFTNGGAPSKNLVYINEYALSAAVLSVHLPTIVAMPTKVDASGNAYKYDLPTLDDPTRPNVNGITDPGAPGYNGIDVDDPWGGNDGLNQAKLVLGGPVQIYSPGYRNLYDIVITKTPGRAGRMYGIDNGANRGWGGHPIGEGSYPGASAGQCINDYDPDEPGSASSGPNDPAVNNENGLHFIRELKPGDENFVAPGERYYAGHPNPIRSNPAGAGLYTGDYNADPNLKTGVWRDGSNPSYPLPVDWPPVPLSMANPAECDFRNSGETDGALVNFKYSTNGITEYTASNFKNGMKGNLLAVGWNETELYRIVLDETGKIVQNATPRGTTILDSSFGSALLDVTAQGDNDVFPGTIWVADFSGHKIFMLEPSDTGDASSVLATSGSFLHYGPVKPGQQTTRSITLENAVGTLPITISGISLTGANAGAFGFSFSGPVVLQPGQSTTVMTSFSPGSLGTKSAQFVVTHTGLNGPMKIDVAGNATNMTGGTAARFRVNAGGQILADGLNPQWEGDLSASGGTGDAETGAPHPYVNAGALGDQTYGLNDLITLDPSVPAGTPASLFQRARWDAAVEPGMQWDIPVPTGKEVEVRLYFAEQVFTAPAVPGWATWPRIFDVSIEGVVPTSMRDVNLFTEVGHDKGLVKSYVVESDGNIDIDFASKSGDPMLQAIEILEVYGSHSSMISGWNLIGVPVTPPNANYATVFVDVLPDVAPYFWNGADYDEHSTVQTGRSYWLHTKAGRAQVFDGTSVQNLAVNLASGWNMIAGPDCSMNFGAISDPSDILIPGTLFGWDNGYYITDVLKSGTGYWVMTSGAGSITMDCAAAGKQTASALSTASLEAFGRLDFEDAKGANQALYYGARLDEAVDIRQFTMPPRSPQAGFDVRYADNRRLIEEENGLIRIQAAAYPVTVTAARMPAGFDEPLAVEELGRDGAIRTHALVNGQSLTIDDPEVIGLRIQAAGDFKDERPERFALLGNYPNPFNPTTTVVFDLPEDGQVRISVYDMLGKRVMTVPSRAMSAGQQRQVVIDASELASGLYLYRIEAVTPSATHVGTGKLILLK